MLLTSHVDNNAVYISDLLIDILLFHKCFSSVIVV